MARSKNPNSNDFKVREFILNDLKDPSKLNWLKDRKNRGEHCNQFIETLDIDNKFENSQYSTMFREVLNELKLNPVDFGLIAESKKEKAKKIKMKVNDGSQQNISQELEIISSDNLKEHLEKNAPKVDEEGQIKINWDAEAVSSIFDAILFVIQIFLPKTPDFTKDESKRLGVIWMPIFTKYINFRILEFLMPTTATALIFKNKIRTGIKEYKKEKELKKGKKKELNEKDEEIKTKCQYCNEERPLDLKEHEKECKKNANN